MNLSTSIKSKRYDVAVIGLGAAGGSALSCIARAGASAIGIDRFAPPHILGSSHGSTRLLRVAYAEGPNYVPMARRSIVLWQQLEERVKRPLFKQTGVIYSGSDKGSFMEAARESAKNWNVDLEDRNAPPHGIAVPPDWGVVYDREGGYLAAEAAIDANLLDATSAGADFITDLKCIAIQIDSDLVVVQTNHGSISVKQAIVTTGAWAHELVPLLVPVTHIERRVIHWFEDSDGVYSAQSGFLPFLIETADGNELYGFSSNSEGKVKIAEHKHGEIVGSPDFLNRQVAQKDLDVIRDLSARYLPQLGPYHGAEVCMYPMSRDGHFIIDRHPANPRIIIGVGLSGHGFKFGPVVGEVLANLALSNDQSPDIDVGFFSLRRFPEFRR